MGEPAVGSDRAGRGTSEGISHTVNEEKRVFDYDGGANNNNEGTRE